MRLFLVRHGRTASNVARVYAGRSDEPLDEAGRAQAREAAERLAAEGVAALYSSPLRRARETAEIMASVLGADVTVDAALTEMALGPWEGLSEDEVARRFPREWALWMDRPSRLRLPGRETLDDVLRRVLPFLERIRLAHAGEAVAVVSHHAPIRVAMIHQDGGDLDRYRAASVANGVPVELETFLPTPRGMIES